MNKRSHCNTRTSVISSLRLLMTAAALGFSAQAAAYVGPGLGAGTLGVILGLLGSIFLALFAFFWYPIKRALFGKKSARDDEEEEFQYPENEVTPAADSTSKLDDK